MRRIDCWEFDTERYFGTESREIREQRAIDLLPEAEAAAPIIISPESSKVSVCQGPVDTAPAPYLIFILFWAVMSFSLYYCVP